MSPASLVPSLDVDVHLVLCDFGRSGLAYVETDPTKADAIVRNLLQGQYERPVRVVGRSYQKPHPSALDGFLVTTRKAKQRAPPWQNGHSPNLLMLPQVTRIQGPPCSDRPQREVRRHARSRSGNASSAK